MTSDATSPGRSEPEALPKHRAQAYEAVIYDTLLEVDETLNAVIQDVLSFWELEPGEDVVIWKDERRVAALIEGTRPVPRYGA